MYRMIIADDENKIRAGLKTLIHWDALHLEIVCECKNGDEVLEALEEMAVDIVLTDMQMPGICGVELMQRLREAFPYVSVIVISGYDDFKYTRQAIVSNAVDYLLKPVDEDELNEALKTAISKVESNKIRRQAEEVEKIPIPVIREYFIGIREREEKEKPHGGGQRKHLAINIREYLDDNYCGHITLSDLESRFYSNKEYISRIFKNFYGVTIFDYIDHLRIKKANDMLLKGEQIKEICYTLGFYDESHFYKKFKKIMGISPSEYGGNIRGNTKRKK